MAIAQFFLSSFPLACCLFVMFFGRMFSHVLRALMVFMVISCPLLGYIVLGGSHYSAGVLANEDSGLTITATFVVACVWCMWANFCVVYTAIKRGSIARKIESIGIGFLITMMINSYYMGHLHMKVIKDRPGVVTYMEWLILLSVIAVSTVIHIVRHFPGMEDIMESFIHGLLGAFLTLQSFTGMGFQGTEGLEWRRVLTHDFGCQHNACIVTMTFFIFLALVGTGVQLWLFKAGNKEQAYDQMSQVLGDMLVSLRNINSAIYSYSAEAEEESNIESLHQLRMTFSEDVYKCLGAVSDALLFTFALGLDAACIEMIYKDAYTMFGPDSFGYGVWLLIFAFLTTCIAIFVVKLRFDTMPILSDEWKNKRAMLLAAVCMLWPFFIGSAFFSMTIGGEEIASVDVPLINQYFGFHLIPIGCDSLNDPAPSIREEDSAAWKATHAEDLFNASWWDGKECHDGLLNGDEESVDCGGSCNRACSDCECHWSRIGASQVTLGTGFPDTIVYEDVYNQFDPLVAAFNGNLTTYGVDAAGNGGNSYCWNGERDTGGLAVRYCFTTGGANCTSDERPNVISNTVLGFEWLDDRDTIRPCSRIEINEVDSGLFLPAITAECPAPPPPPPPPRRLWYCDATKIGHPENNCYDCEHLKADGTDVDWDTPVCNFATGVTCNDVATLKMELPTIVRLVWGVALTSMISALAGSGSLGGTYMLISRLTTYLTSLNFVQGILIVVISRLMSSATGDVVSELESVGGELEDSAMGATEGMSAAEAAQLQSQLEGMSLWNGMTGLGVLMILSSMLGLGGMKLANQKAGGCMLWGYLLTLAVTFIMSCCLFGVAVYFALNIDEIADEYWEVIIQPNLAMTNASAIESYDLSEMQKHEFVELSRGSFRCLILVGTWVASLVLALIVGVYYTLGQRGGEGAARALARKGAVSNPMWVAQKQGDDMNSPLTTGMKGGLAAAGAAMGAGAAAVAATGGGVADVGSAFAEMVVVDDSADAEPHALGSTSSDED